MLHSEPPIPEGAGLDALDGYLRWVAWRYDPDPARPDKPRKMPYAPTMNGTLVRARTNDPSTWGSRAAAEALGLSGVGFVLSGHPNLCALDLDDCRDRDSGRLSPWAQDLVDRCGSYTEITPSGTGLRILGIAIGITAHRKLPRPDGGSLEIYAGGATRYVLRHQPGARSGRKIT